MEKVKHFRALWGTLWCFILATLIWWRAEWSAVQIGCFVVILLAGVALLVNNQRNEAFQNAAFIPLLAACIVYFWTPTRSIFQGVINFVVSLWLVWVVVKPYYTKWKKSHSSADGSSDTPVEIEGKSNG